jgi:hypothetical protein
MMTKTDFEKAAARYEEQRDMVLRDIEQLVARTRATGTGFTHLAHNLSARVVELAEAQAKFDTLKQIADFTEQ